MILILLLPSLTKGITRREEGDGVISPTGERRGYKRTTKTKRNILKDEGIINPYKHSNPQAADGNSRLSCPISIMITII